jgi:hypothetical protein
MTKYTAHIGSITSDRSFATFQVHARDVYEATAAAQKDPRVRQCPGLEVKKVVRA